MENFKMERLNVVNIQEKHMKGCGTINNVRGMNVGCGREWKDWCGLV